ncbi:MAG TPA: amidohydrolase family protein [Planctomycetaceae bacterium]|nr:amidohydrolase family protein [Planctomycetaceae bacterium]
MQERSNWTRRGFLEATGAALVAAATDSCGSLRAAPELDLIIDCHAHVYSEDEKTYPAMEKPYRPPAGTGTVAHLEREMQSSGVKSVMAVQTLTFYHWDNSFLADTSRDNKRIMAGVCALNPDDPASPKILEKYVKSYNVRAMRSIPAKSGKLDDPGVEALWATAERLGIVINAFVDAPKQGEVETMVKRHLKLPVVIDHCLNLKAGPTLQPTLKAMQALAALPTVHAKLSFVPTGSAEEYPCRDMHDACRTIIKEFGPERCLWGSCFPCELWCPKVTYAQHLRIFTHEIGLDERTKRALLGETPRRLWFS